MPSLLIWRTWLERYLPDVKQLAVCCTSQCELLLSPYMVGLGGLVQLKAASWPFELE